MMSTIIIKVDGVDITADVVFSRTTFTSLADGNVGSCSITIDDQDQVYPTGHFDAGQTVELFVDGERAWDGWVFIVGRSWPFSFDDTSVPALTPRFWILTGQDRNLLFRSRITFRQSDPTDNSGFKIWPTGTSDKVALEYVLDNYVDLSSDGLTRNIESIGSPGPFEEFTLGFVSAPLGVIFEDAAKMTGGVYFIAPDRSINYVSDMTPSAPFALSDTPSGSEAGYRELEAALDYSQAANEALVWGAGKGSDDPVFAKYTNSSAVSSYGLWQWGDLSVGAWKQETVDRRAETYVEGSPTHRRGHGEPVPVVRCVIFEPGLTAGMVVSFTSDVFGYQQNLPVRSSTISFPTDKSVRYELELTLRIDDPFVAYDLWPWPPWNWDAIDLTEPPIIAGPPAAKKRIFISGIFWGDGPASGPTFEGLYPQSGADRGFISAFEDGPDPVWNLLMNDDQFGTITTIEHPDEDPHPATSFPVSGDMEPRRIIATDDGVFVFTDTATIYKAGWPYSWWGVHKYSHDGEPQWSTFLNRSWFSADPYMVINDGSVYLHFGGVRGELVTISAVDGTGTFDRVLDGPGTGPGETLTTYVAWPNSLTTPDPYWSIPGSGWRLHATWDGSEWDYNRYNVGVWPSVHTWATGEHEQEWVAATPRTSLSWNRRFKVQWDTGATNSTAEIDLYDWGDVFPFAASGSSGSCPVHTMSSYKVGSVGENGWYSPADGSSIFLSPSVASPNDFADAYANIEDYDNVYGGVPPPSGTDPEDWVMTREEWIHNVRLYPGLCPVSGGYVVASYPYHVIDGSSGDNKLHRYSSAGVLESTATLDTYITSSYTPRLIPHPTDDSYFYVIRRTGATWYMDLWNSATMTFVANVFSVSVAAAAAKTFGVAVDDESGYFIRYADGAGDEYAGHDPDGTQQWYEVTGVESWWTPIEHSVLGDEFAVVGYDVDSLPLLKILQASTGATLIDTRTWAEDAYWGAAPTAGAAIYGGAVPGSIPGTISEIPVYDGEASTTETQVYVTNYPYMAGSLIVYLDGIRLRAGVDYVETNPSAGEFVMLMDPQATTTGSIYSKYLRASTEATGASGVVYRPQGQTSFGWGTPLDGYNALMAASAMALDRHTEGAYTMFVGSPRSTPPNHRGNQSNQSSLGGIADVATAWTNGWGQTLELGGDMTFASFAGYIGDGRGGILLGTYGNMDTVKRFSLSFSGPHALFINERFTDGSFLGYDPLYPYPVIYTSAQLVSFASGYATPGLVRAAFTQVT